MNDGGGFVTKRKFQAVLNHYRDVVAKAEAEGNSLHVEFHLLIEYFKTVFSDSERKTHKIHEILTNARRTEALLSDLRAARAAEKEELCRQLRETTGKMHELFQKEQGLTKQVEDLRRVVRRLKGLYDQEEEEKAAREVTTSDVGVVTDEIKAQVEWRAFVKECLESGDEVAREIGRRERLENVIQELVVRANAHATEKEMALTECERLEGEVVVATAHHGDLRAAVAERDLRVQELEAEVEALVRARLGLEASLSDKEKMKLTIDKLVRDLHLTKLEMQGLEHLLQQEKNSLSQVQVLSKSKDKDLENLRRLLALERQAKETAIRKGQVFDRHLAKDRQRREGMQREVDGLKGQVEKLSGCLTTCEAQKRALLAEMKADEQNHRLEMRRVSDTYQVQLKTKDSELESLRSKLSDTQKQLSALRKLHACKSVASFDSELEKVKAELQDLKSAHKTAQCQLAAYKTAFKAEKTQMDGLMRMKERLMHEKNVFSVRFKELEAKMESEEWTKKLLMSERQYHRRVLRSLDNQADKVAVQHRRKPFFKY